MIRGFLRLASVGIMTLVLMPGIGHGESCTLEIRKAPDYDDRGITAESGEHWALQYTDQQRFVAMLGDPDMEKSAAEAFRKVIKKEPEKYKSSTPLRFVAQLGSRSYGFVFDAGSSKKGYDLLYFDVNGNGDLTDEQVIKARKDRSYSSVGYSRAEFPRIDLKIKVDEAEFEYAVALSVDTHKSEDTTQSWASLQGRTYRAGEIEIEGKRRKILLLDYNSNGRFDDTWSVDRNLRGTDDSLYPQSGDVLVIDPEPAPSDFRAIYDLAGCSRRHYVSKLVNLDGKYYAMKVAPAGDRLELAPVDLKTGTIENPNEAFIATVHSDEHGFLKMRKTATQPAALPEGSWRMISYKIDLTDQQASSSRPASGSQPESSTQPQEEGAKPKKRRGLLSLLAKAVVGDSSVVLGIDMPKYTHASGQGTRNGPEARVRAGQTVTFPFGPPYKPVVSVMHMANDKEVYLSMKLVGLAGGEVCTDLMIKGDRPTTPRFTITTAAGEEVQRGKFEFG